MKTALLLCLVSAEKPNPKTDVLAAKGPAAILEALETELAEAEAVGDKEHAASIKKHWADYLSERKEYIEDHEGGHSDTREAAAAGRDDRHHATPKQFAAVEAALNSEIPEAEKFGDAEHIASIKKHLADYADQEESNG